VLGIVLDGIPESAVIGMTVLEGQVSIAVLVGVFVSNVPEAIAATAGLAASGRSPRAILLLWVGIAAVSALAALAGYGLLEGASGSAGAFLLAFAGGAILTMLADTMMPEAFEKGGPLAGVVTSAGFALAFLLTTLE
jgi:ZIP family zinc transporter